MARSKNDGRGRIGGRAKGTPNKITTNTREWLVILLQKQRKQIEKDLKNLTSEKRVQLFERLLQYIIPKQQTMSVDVDLETLSDDQFDDIISKISNNDQVFEAD